MRGSRLGSCGPSLSWERSQKPNCSARRRGANSRTHRRSQESFCPTLTAIADRETRWPWPRSWTMVRMERLDGVGEPTGFSARRDQPGGWRSIPRSPANPARGNTCPTCGYFPTRATENPTATRSSPAPIPPTANTCFRGAGTDACACGPPSAPRRWERSRLPPSPSPPAPSPRRRATGVRHPRRHARPLGRRLTPAELTFLAHTRPISAIAFANDGRTMPPPRGIAP